VERDEIERFPVSVQAPDAGPVSPDEGGPFFTMQDPLWNIVGIGQSDGPGDVSSSKLKYLAEASADNHREP
jgi:hypothetical protein